MNFEIMLITIVIISSPGTEYRGQICTIIKTTSEVGDSDGDGARGARAGR